MHMCTKYKKRDRDTKERKYALRTEAPTQNLQFETMRTTLFLLLFSGTLCSGLQRIYHVIREPKTWSAAQSYCREKHTDLATIDDMEDMNKLIDAAGSGFVASVWIGHYDNLYYGWRWSLSDEALYTEGGQNFSNWATAQPNNHRNLEACGAMVSWTGDWTDSRCEVPAYFVCYHTIIKGMENSTSGSYIYVNEEKNWTDAQRYCRQHYTDLASARSQTENEKIREVVPGRTIVWIGLFRHPWTSWSEGSNSSFRFWMQGQPDNRYSGEHCATSELRPSHSGRWEDRDCSDRGYFICHDYQMKKHFFRIKLTSVNSVVDLNNPAMTEAILKQMERKMQDAGLSEDLQLGWIKGPDSKVFHTEENETDLAVCLSN